MDYPPRIRTLLDLYWKAETSIEEERELRNYFLLHPEHSDGHTAYFTFLSNESEIEMQAPPEAIMRPVVRRWRAVAGMAAAILILIVAGIVIQHNVQPPANGPEVVASEDSYENPEEAYEQARQALLMVSQKLNASRAQASEQLDKAKPYTEILK